jgi:hypothetical protein
MPTVTYQIGTSSDDCAISFNNTGSVWSILLTSSYVTIGTSTTNTSRRRGNGYRFIGVTIPNSAVIDSAYLQVYSNGTNATTTVQSKIVAEQNTNAAAFSTIDDYQARRGTDVGGANNNNITTASIINTNMPGWGSWGTKQNSDDIKTIIKELVDDYSGLSSANIVLFWDDHQGLSDNTTGDNRGGISYDQNTSYAPKLEITYHTSPVSHHTGSGIGTGIGSGIG